MKASDVTVGTRIVFNAPRIPTPGVRPQELGFFPGGEVRNSNSEQVVSCVTEIVRGPELGEYVFHTESGVMHVVEDGGSVATTDPADVYLQVDLERWGP
jgi:hypothetical protein